MLLNCYVGEDLRVPWTARRSDQSILKEISPEYSLIGRTDAEAPILWLPDVKDWLTVEDSDAGKDWRQEKGKTEDEMVGWHHQLDGREFEQAPGVGDGQGSLVCCSPWDCKKSDTTEQLNWTEYTEISNHYLMLLELTECCKSTILCLKKKLLNQKQNNTTQPAAFRSRRQDGDSKFKKLKTACGHSNYPPLWKHFTLEHQNFNQIISLL